MTETEAWAAHLPPHEDSKPPGGIDTSTEAVKRLLENVTPGPWDHEWEIDGPKTHTRIKAGAAIATTAPQCGRPHHRSAASSNARFIAAARDLVPALLKERDEARALAALEVAPHVNEPPKSEHNRADVLTAVPTAPAADAAKVDIFYIDCEFDGHNGPLLSIAMVRGDGYSLHVEVIEDAKDPWVIANIMPIMDAHRADVMRVAGPNYVGSVLRQFIGGCTGPTIIADSPVDIGRFCRAISTGKDGKWQSADFSQMNFVVHNVDCYPTTLDGAVQHNAWWDAMALRAALAALKDAPVTLADALQVPEVRALVELAEELITAVWHLMDNSEESGPIEDPQITVWKPNFDEVSAILDRIEGLPSGSTEHMTAGELFAANVLAALEPATVTLADAFQVPEVRALVEALQNCPPTNNPTVTPGEHLDRIDRWWRLYALTALRAIGEDKWWAAP